MSMQDELLIKYLGAMLAQVLLYGALSVSGLFIIGLVTGNVIVVTCSLLSAGAAYLAGAIAAMAAIEPSIGNFNRLLNPTLTVISILLWIVGVYFLWG